MSDFAKQLKSVRTRLGFRSAKAFYDSIKKGRKLAFNYSYYVRIENGETLPSAGVVSALASLVSEADSGLLVQSYCQSLFPKHSHLFTHYENPEEVVSGREEKSPIVQRQNELSRFQVDSLSRNRETYYLFLLTTLARVPIKKEGIKSFFPEAKLSKAVKLLEDAELLVRSGDVENEALQASSIEMRFPKGDDFELKTIYKQLDQWDQEFGDHFELESMIQKLLIRRISFRYLGLIQGQLQLLFDLVKSADETDLKYNDKVMQLTVSMKCGKLPG